jgi:hypothetical protein
VSFDGVRDLSHRVDWGTAPDWFLAAFALLALIFAAGAARAAWDAVSIERARDQQRQEAEERHSQAEYVAAWPGFDVTWGATVRNASPLPIYSVTVRFEAEDGATRQQVTIPFAEPAGDTFVAWPAECRLVDHLDDNGKPVFIEPRSSIWPDLRFRDSAGRWWSRGRDGILKRS